MQQKPHEGPTLQRQRAVADDLREYFAKIDAKTKTVSESDQEEIVEEAIRSVRPGYRPISL